MLACSGCSSPGRESTFHMQLIVFFLFPFLSGRLHYAPMAQQRPWIASPSPPNQWSFTGIFFMNGFLLGSLTSVAAGAVTYGLKNAYLITGQFHNLTDSTEALRQELSIIYDEPMAESDIPIIPLKDIISIYLNSRGNRGFVNRLRVHTDSEHYSLMLKNMEKNHCQIKLLALACVGERLLDRLVPNCNSIRNKRLLWIYADEQGVLDQISDFCSPQERYFISSRI